MKWLTLLGLVCVSLPVARPDDSTTILLTRWVKELDDKDQEVRVRALQGLSRLGKDVKPALPAMAKALKDMNVEIRREAARALGVLATHAVETVPALAEALQNDKEAKVRSYAAFAFKAMGRDAKGGVPALIVALKDKDEEVRCVAADALGRMGDIALPAIDALAIALKDREAGPHVAAALGRLGPVVAKAAIPALEAALQNGELRSHAAQTLAQIGAVEQMTKALADKDEDVRVEVVLALRLLGKAGVAALRIALKDKAADVKANAANVLAKMGPDAAGASAELAALLKDPNEEVRYQTALALTGIGPAAKAILPQLEAAKEDEDKKVRRAIADAIKAVKGE